MLEIFYVQILLKETKIRSAYEVFMLRVKSALRLTIELAKPRSGLTSDLTIQAIKNIWYQNINKCKQTKYVL